VKKPNRLRIAAYFAIAALSLLVGSSIGVLYAFRNPIEIVGVCRIQIPEFLVPQPT
jgi:hypothetical protein